MTVPSQIIVTSRADGRTVYHLGTLGLPGAAPPINLPGYKVGNTVVPSHGWLQQWTERPNPVAVKRSPAQIIAVKRMFPFGDTGCQVEGVKDYTFAGPMDSAGITKYMPTTGERPDIGLITDPSALFMLTGKEGPMLAWAMAGGSCTIHFRDETTGKPVDLLKYPGANAYDYPGQNSPWLDKGPPTPTSNGYHQFADNWTPQQAHFCEMSYLAHIATGDLGFLEDLQYAGNFVVLSNATISNAARGAVISGEDRGISWAFRSLFMAHIATKDAEARRDLPAECHPSSYFKKLLDQSLAYYAPVITSTDPIIQRFRLVAGADRFGPWQADYMLSALAFGVLTGHADWAPLYLWALGNVIARTNGKSGYPPGWGQAYYLNTYEWGRNADGTYNQGAFDKSKPLDWYGSFLFLQSDPNSTPPTAAQIATLKTDPLNRGKAMQGQGYNLTTRAVLIQAAYLEKIGLLNVRAAYPDLDLCLTNIERMVRNNGSMVARASYVLDPSQAPDTIPPVTPPIDPPPGGIDMPDSYSIETGKHGFIPVTPNGTLSSGPFYTTDNPAVLGNLSGSPDGVRFDAIAEGEAHIIATAQGAVPISKTVQVTVTAAVPLATATDLDFGELVVS